MGAAAFVDSRHALRFVALIKRHISMVYRILLVETRDVIQMPVACVPANSCLHLAAGRSMARR
jgi:hypothetical protein